MPLATTTSPTMIWGSMDPVTTVVGSQPMREGTALHRAMPTPTASTARARLARTSRVHPPRAAGGGPGVGDEGRSSADTVCRSGSRDQEFWASQVRPMEAVPPCVLFGAELLKV